MKIAFRVDASSQIGSGHLMRCVTLADALKQRGANTCFLSRHLQDYLREMLAIKGHDFKLLSSDSHPNPMGGGDIAHAEWLGTSQEEDALDTLRALASSAQTWDWLVVDHYALDARWELMVRPVVSNILAIDDLADRRHDCELLLDQNFYVDKETRYADKVPDRCRLLLGPRYALLREEFCTLHKQVISRNGPVRRLLIFFGGVDADDYTSRALQALARIGLSDMQVDVVVGAQHPARSQVEAICIHRGFSYYVQTDRMAELMALADLSIGAGGSTVWERCSLGLPTIAFGTAGNQLGQIAGAASEGLLYAPDSKQGFAHAIALHLPALMGNSELRNLISRKGLHAVDGKGVFRVVSLMRVTGLRLRVARPEDSNAVFAWRNHHSIRDASRDPNPIIWEDHQAWFSDVLRDQDRVLLIAEKHTVPVGVVRFDIENIQAEISIYLVPEQEDAVSGRDLLQSAEIWLAQNLPDVEILRAHVMGANTRSHGLFHGAGYEVESTSYIKRLNHL